MNDVPEVIELRVILHGEHRIKVNARMYREARDEGTVDLVFASELVELDTDTVVIEPDGTVFRPLGGEHMFDAPAREELAGPWAAVLADTMGFVLEGLDDVEDVGMVSVRVACGTALPRDGRLGDHDPNDLLYRADDTLFDSIEDVERAWSRARAVADGLNYGIAGRSG